MKFNTNLIEGNDIKISFLKTPAIEEIITKYENFSFNQAIEKIDLLEQSLNYSKLNLLEKLTLIYLKFLSLGIIQKIEESISCIEKLDFIKYDFNDFETEFCICTKLLHNSLAIQRSLVLKNYTTGIELIEIAQNYFISQDIESYVIKENKDILFYSAYHYEAIAGLYFDKGDYDKALEFFKKALKLRFQLEEDFYIYFAYHYLESVSKKKNDLDSTLFYLTDRLNYFLEKSSRMFTIRSFRIIGHFYLNFKKDLMKALEYYNNSLELLNKNELNTDQEIELYLINLESIGNIHQYIGDDKGIDVFNLILANENIDKEPFIDLKADILISKGKYYFQKKEFQKALNDFLDSLSIYKEFGSLPEITDSYYYLIQTYLKVNALNDAEILFKKFEELNEKITQIRFPYPEAVEAKLCICKALILKEKQNMQDTANAQSLLEKLIENSENLKYEDLIDGLLPLISLTLEEYRLFPVTKNYEKLTSLINKLVDLSEKNNSIKLRINSLILKSKFEYALGNFEEVDQLINKALLIAKEFKLENISKEVQEEKEKNSRELIRMNELIKSNKTMLDRLNQAEIEDYVKLAQGIINR